MKLQVSVTYNRVREPSLIIEDQNLQQLLLRIKASIFVAESAPLFPTSADHIRCNYRQRRFWKPRGPVPLSFVGSLSWTTNSALMVES